MTQPPLMLSVFATFAIGGPQVRFVSLANHYGRAWRHVVVSMDGKVDCATRLSPELDVTFLSPPIRPRALVANIAPFRRVLRDLAPDVLVTNNWGSIEWAVANQLGGGVRHVHIEDGFGPDELGGQKLRRVLARRYALRRCPVIVPSVTLLKISTELWRLPPAHVHYIPNGIDFGRFQPADAQGGQLAADRGPPLVGAVAALRPEKNFGRLLRATRLLLDEGTALRVVIVGDGPERARLEAMAAELQLSDTVTFAGAVADPSQYLRAFDVFAISSDSEQMPLALLEAMATGLPVVATPVSDVPQMLARENRPFLCSRDDASLADALRRMLRDSGLRRRIGAANRAKVERDYDERHMFRRYQELFAPSSDLRPPELGAFEAPASRGRRVPC